MNRDAILDNAACAVTLAGNHLDPDDLLEILGDLRRELSALRQGGTDYRHAFALADRLESRVLPEGREHATALRRALIELTVEERPCANF